MAPTRFRKAPVLAGNTPNNNKESIVKTSILARVIVLIALASGGAAQAAAATAPVGTSLQPGASAPAESGCPVSATEPECDALPDPAVAAKAPQIDPAVSPVPEPEVFAMMLLGLCLIGYRANRTSVERFTE